MKKFLDCISVVGSTPSRFQGTKKYVSTGAVATTEIDESEVVEVSYEDRPSRANLTAEAGDILFAKMQGTRKTLLLDSETEENIYSTGFYAVRANPEIITTECLYYLVDSELFLAQKDKNCSGATQKAITNGGLAKIEIRIPPLSEQAVLTEKLRYLTQLIADRKKQLELFDEVIKSRFIEMFGDPNNNPMRWSKVKLAECLTNIENGKSFVCDSEARTGANPAVLKLSAATYGYYQPHENKAMLDDTLFVENAEVHKGDLLFTRKNTPELVGMCAYVYETPAKLMMPDLIFRLNTKSNCNKIFLWKIINLDLFRSNVTALSSGSAKSMSNISKERLMGLEIILPPIELQNQFAAFVEQTDKSKYHGESTYETEVVA